MKTTKTHHVVVSFDDENEVWVATGTELATGKDTDVVLYGVRSHREASYVAYTAVEALGWDDYTVSVTVNRPNGLVITHWPMPRQHLGIVERQTPTALTDW